MVGRRKFPRCSNFRVAPLFLHFLLFFPSGIWSVMLSLNQIHRAWIDSIILALLACKNCKSFPQNAISRIIGTLMCKLG